MARKSKGRQRLPMQKIQNESNLQVTFSKRRSGLFKKSSELSTLCGCDIAIVVFSPGQKVYSFGHPSVESVIDRYLKGNPPPEHPRERYVVAHRDVNLRELNAHLTNTINTLETAKTHGEALNGIRLAREQQLWERPTNEMNMEELLQIKAGLEGFKMSLNDHAHKLMLEGASPAQDHASSSSLRIDGGSVAALHPPTSGPTGNSGPFSARIPGYNVFDPRSPIFAPHEANNFVLSGRSPVFDPTFQNFGGAGSVPLNNLGANLVFTGFDRAGPSSFIGGQVPFGFVGDIPYEDSRGSAVRIDNEARTSRSDSARAKGKATTSEEFNNHGHGRRFL